MSENPAQSPPQGLVFPSSDELPDELMAFDGEMLVGEEIDKWTITEVIGEGGMSIVYKAEHNWLDQVAAIKLLRPECSENRRMMERFQREAVILSRLRHPNIIEVKDFGIDPEYGHFMVLELLEGDEFTKPLQQAPLGNELLLDVMRQICDALDVTHKAGIIHRDLKPSNIFISLKAGAPHIKLLDFGVAKVQFQEDAKQLTSTGMIMGTPSYIAPEQLMPENELTAATDIYALGVILFEALTGRLPIDGGHSIEHATLVLTQEPLTLGALRSELAHSALEELIGKMLQKDPQQRPPSIKALWQSFQQALIALSRQPVQKPKKSQLASRCISLDTPTEMPLLTPKKSQQGVQSAPIAFTFKGGQLVAAPPPAPMSEGSSTPNVRIKPSGEHESLDAVELRPPSSDELAQTFDLPEEITEKYKPTPPPQTQTPVKTSTPASSMPSLKQPHTFDHTTPLPLHEDVRPKHQLPITSKHFEDTDHPARPRLSKQTQPKKNVQASKRISQERDKLQTPPSSDSKLLIGVVLVFMILLGAVNLYLYLKSPSPQYQLPTRLKRVWQRGQQALQQKQFDAAITFFEQITRDRAWKQSQTYPRLYARIARLHAKKKRYTYATRYMRMYIRDVKQLYRTYQQLRNAPLNGKREYKLSLLRRQLPNTKTFNTEKWALSSWEEALRQKKKKD